MNSNSNNEKEAGLCIHTKHMHSIQKSVEAKAWSGNKHRITQDGKHATWIQRHEHKVKCWLVMYSHLDPWWTEQEVAFAQRGMKRQWKVLYRWIICLIYAKKRLDFALWMYILKAIVEAVLMGIKLTWRCIWNPEEIWIKTKRFRNHLHLKPQE